MLKELFLTKFPEILCVADNVGLHSVSWHVRNNGVLLYTLIINAIKCSNVIFYKSLAMWEGSMNPSLLIS
jgi:hypothetical protein